MKSIDAFAWLKDVKYNLFICTDSSSNENVSATLSISVSGRDLYRTDLENSELFNATLTHF